MGTRFEFFEAKRTAVRVWDALQTEEEYTVALFGDTVAAFVGTLGELRALAERIIAEVDAAGPKLPELVPPAGEDVEDAVCQYVWTQADVDEAVQRNERANAERRAMHGGDARLVDAATYGVPTVGETCGECLTLWERVVDARNAHSWDRGALIIGDSSLGEGEVDSLSCTAGHAWAVPEMIEYT